MAIEVLEVRTTDELKEFVELPFELYRDNPYWVPPIKSEERNALLPQKNPAMRGCDTILWIARKEGKCVGRLAGIIHHKHNEKTGEKMARFSRAEFIDDTEVVDTLFAQAEKWAKANGAGAIHGPLGFSNLDHQGMLVEGFDYLPSVVSEYHLPYYQEHMERLGYSKEMDWIEFRLSLAGFTLPDKAVRINDMVKRRYGLKVVNFKTRKELHEYGQRVFEILNSAFRDLFSVVEFNKETSSYYLNKYIPLLNPKFVKMIEDGEGKIAGFIIALPSLSRALQKANGKVFPFGFYHIRKALKNPTECDLLLTGVHPDWQGKGMVSLLFSELLQELIGSGIQHLETTGMLETNYKAIQNWKNFDHIQHKRKRCYRKDLD